MSRPLPRYTNTTTEDQAKLERILREADANQPAVTTHTTATLPGDRRRLRGIPVAGAAGGTSPGTDPLAALLNRRA